MNLNFLYFSIQGEELHQKREEGVIQSNQSLVLQKVRRSSSGRYSCEGSNSQGTTRSGELDLTVKCE